MNRDLKTLLIETQVIAPKKDKYKFEDIIESVSFSAPENMYMWWEEANTIIHELSLTNNENPEYKWQVDLLSSWSTKPNEEICNYYDLNYDELKDDINE